MYVNDSFPYYKHKGAHFSSIEKIKEYYENDSDGKKHRHSIHLDYCKELGMYRITHFIDDHWCNDIIFEEANKDEI